MDAALLTMVTALFVAVLATARDHRQSLAEHKRITERNHTEVTGSLGDTRERLARIEEQYERLHGDVTEHRRITEKNHTEVTGSLGDARERLARIEGHLGVGFPPPTDPSPDR